MNKLIFTALLAMMCGGVNAQEVLDTTSVNAKLLTAEGNKMPKYKSGIASVMQYLANNIKYPKEAERNGVEGRVVVSFLVNKDGMVCNVKPVKVDLKFFDLKKMSEKTGKSEQDLRTHYTWLFSNEATRVISAMPKWKPAVFEGEKVGAYCRVPVTFAIPRFTNTRIGR